MNIVYSTSDYYLAPTICSILSVIENITISCNFIVLSNDLSESSKKELGSVINDTDHSINVLEISSKLNSLASEFTLPKSRGSYSTYARIFLSELLPMYSHVWLFDSDTLVVGDVSSLSKYEKYHIAAVPDYVVLNKYSQHESDDLVNDTYFNMGVVGLNLKAWRDDGLLSLLRKNFDKDLDLKIVDQTIINRHFRSYIHPLPLKYNFYTYFHSKLDFDFLRHYAKEGLFLSSKDLAEAEEGPVIIHFIGFWFERPWFNEGLSPFKSKYTDYWERMKNLGYNFDLFEKPKENFVGGVYSGIFRTLILLNLRKTHYFLRYIVLQIFKKIIRR